MIKKEIRIIGIDDGPFDKFKDKSTIVIGVIYRGGNFLDGVVSTKVKVDGNNSTDKLIGMINKCKFKPQLQAIMLDGIALGGFNVVDVLKLNKKTNIPVIVVMRSYPDFDKIKKALVNINKKNKIRLLEKAGKVNKAGNVYIQNIGISLEKAEKMIKIAATHSYLPEPIRVAHIIASGVVRGESKGKA